MARELENPIIHCSLKAGKGGIRKLTLYFSKVTALKHYFLAHRVPKSFCSFFINSLSHFTIKQPVCLTLEFRK